MLPEQPVGTKKFLSTPSARRRRGRSLWYYWIAKNFYPRLREEATVSHDQRRYHLQHFYPRPPRGGDLHLLLTPVRWRVISIHALREEGDFLRIDTFP